MFTIKSIKVCVLNTNTCLAYIYPNDDYGWRDPYGGTFSDDNIRHLDEVIDGARTGIILDKFYSDVRTVVVKE